jgi:hypothetical protein
VTHVGGEGSGEVKRGEVESDDVTAGGVAGEVRPSAMVGGLVP